MLIPISITSKGHAFIPKSVRDEIGLLPGRRAFVSVSQGKAVVQSAPTIDEIYGFVNTKKVLTKKQMKTTVRRAVLEKFRRKNADMKK